MAMALSMPEGPAPGAGGGPRAGAGREALAGMRAGAATNVTGAAASVGGAATSVSGAAASVGGPAASAGMGHVIRLPLSAVEARLRAPRGFEDLLLVEQRGSALEVALQLMQCVVSTRDADVNDLATLPLYDLDVLLLRLRQSLLGNRIETDAACQASGCGARMDISFGIDEYLSHHRPLAAPWRTRRWFTAPADEAGWFRLTRRGDSGESGLFRLPTARDLLETQQRGGVVTELTQRCIRPAGLRARELRFIESALETIAPSLASDLHGACPECSAPIVVAYEPRRYCIAELRQRARFVLEEVDLLAQRYHWSEGEILAMPNSRRVAYAELARQARGEA